MDASSVCLLHIGDLHKLGVRYSRQHLDRMEKAGQFPRRVKLTPNGSVRWVESEIHDWLRNRIANRVNTSSARRDGGEYAHGR
jgi:prophage regulatory protein